MGIFTYQGKLLARNQDLKGILQPGIFIDQRLQLGVKEITNQSSNRIRRNRLQLLDMIHQTQPQQNIDQFGSSDDSIPLF